jgi:ferredoxin hydrogenase large subunit
MSFLTVNAQCNGCLACVQNCPAGALRAVDQGDQRTISHNISLCARCGHCWRICPQGAIQFETLLQGRWEEVVSLDLIHCQVCGEPIYTRPFRKELLRKVEKPIEALCPTHKQTVALQVWKQVSLSRNQETECKK